MATVAARRGITKISRSSGYPNASSETAINVPQISSLKNTVQSPLAGDYAGHKSGLADWTDNRAEDRRRDRELEFLE